MTWISFFFKILLDLTKEPINNIVVKTFWQHLFIVWQTVFSYYYYYWYGVTIDLFPVQRFVSIITIEEARAAVHFLKRRRKKKSCYSIFFFFTMGCLRRSLVTLHTVERLFHLRLFKLIELSSIVVRKNSTLRSIKFPTSQFSQT